MSIVSSESRLQCPAEQNIYVVVSIFARPSILDPISRTGGAGPRPSGQQFGRQMEKAEHFTLLDLCACQGAGIRMCRGKYYWL